jgi:hypothetical protein
LEDAAGAVAAAVCHGERAAGARSEHARPNFDPPQYKMAGIVGRCTNKRGPVLSLASLFRIERHRGCDKYAATGKFVIRSIWQPGAISGFARG